MFPGSSGVGMTRGDVGGATMPLDVAADSLRQRILTVRGVQVMLDRDLAELYGVETKVLNQAVRRNANRFPDGFAFTLTEQEMRELVTTCDRLARLKHSGVAAKAFSEQGIAMLCPYLGFSGRITRRPSEPSQSLAQIRSRQPLETQRTFPRAASEVPQVSPKPYARSWATRSQTVNWPASAIPLPEACVASEIQRVARLRAASCATPASLPSPTQHTWTVEIVASLTPVTASGLNAVEDCRSRGRQRRRGGETRRVFRADVAGDAPIHFRGLMRKRKSMGLFTLQSHVGGARKSSERTAPRAAVDSEPACRWVGKIKIRCKGGRCLRELWKESDYVS